MRFTVSGLQSSSLYIQEGSYFIHSALFHSIKQTNSSEKGGAIKAVGSLGNLALVDVWFDETSATAGGSAVYCDCESSAAFEMQRVCCTHAYSDGQGVAMDVATGGRISSEYTSFTAIDADGTGFHLNYLYGADVAVAGYNDSDVRLAMYAAGITTKAKSAEVRVAFSNFQGLVCTGDAIEIYQAPKTTFYKCNFADITCTLVEWRIFFIGSTGEVTIEDCILRIGRDLKFEYYHLLSPSSLLIQNCVLDHDIIPTLHLTATANSKNEPNCDLKRMTFLSSGLCEAVDTLIRPTLIKTKRYKDCIAFCSFFLYDC